QHTGMIMQRHICSHRDFGMVCSVRMIEKNVNARNPHAIKNADHEAMEEISSCAFSCNLVRAKNKNNQPKKWFDAGWDPENSSETHSKTKKGEMKDQSPVHVKNLK